LARPASLLGRESEVSLKSATARASELDPRTREHPKIDSVFEKDGKPQDVQHASVAPQRDQLVVWLMSYKKQETPTRPSE